MVNFFLINESFYLVDLPGYGFAQVAKEEQTAWADMIENYLSETRSLKALMILLDIRHEPSENDMMMFKWAAMYGLPVICVATKADKIAKSKRFFQLSMIRKVIGYGKGFEIFPVSSQDKFGKEDLLDAINAYVSS